MQKKSYWKVVMLISDRCLLWRVNLHDFIMTVSKLHPHTHQFKHLLSSPGVTDFCYGSKGETIWPFLFQKACAPFGSFQSVAFCSRSSWGKMSNTVEAVGVRLLVRFTSQWSNSCRLSECSREHCCELSSVTLYDLECSFPNPQLQPLFPYLLTQCIKFQSLYNLNHTQRKESVKHTVWVFYNTGKLQHIKVIEL